MQLLYDNIIFDLQKIGGISIYWKELIKHVMLDAEIELSFIQGKKQNQNFIYQTLVNDNPLINDIPHIRPFINNRYFPLIRLNKTSKVIFHSSYYRPFLDINSKKVVTVHDFIYEHFEKGLKKNVHAFQKKMALSNADIVICISENTKRDLISFYPKFKNKDIRVIYNGVSNNYFPIENLTHSGQFERPYLLVVGNRVGCKNFKNTIEAYRNYLVADYDLKIVGKPLTEEEKRLLMGCHDHIEIMNNVSEEKLNLLYNDAYALIFPSTYEGFGIPIIEAMKAGCPVITTEESCIKEVAGNGGVYMESLDAKGIIEAINRLNNKSYRNDIIANGLRHSSQFSWDKTYINVKNIYSELNDA